MESNMDKQYRVRVTEKHVDHVWVSARSREEACDLAPALSECEYDLLYDCEVVQEYDDE
tara:strand:- start:125 stop:301 length:177 start_codon:yes stop_codon:yes gene_type:complete